MELREMLDADEIRDDDFRSCSLLAGPDRRRAELEIRMQRLRRTKFAAVFSNTGCINFRTWFPANVRSGDRSA